MVYAGISQTGRRLRHILDQPQQPIERHWLLRAEQCDFARVFNGVIESVIENTVVSAGTQTAIWNRVNRQHSFGIGGVLMMKSVITKRVLCLLIFMGSALAQRTYTTNFSNAETPLSESHSWINGGTCADTSLCVALDWHNVNTTSGLAFGTQSGVAPPPYPDSTALVTGSWGENQYVQVVVHWDGASGTNNDYDEVEIRLRSAMAPHRAKGYLINCRVGTPSSNSYMQMGRMNGVMGDFLAPGTWGSGSQCSGSKCGCQNGDVLTGAVTNDGNGHPVITAYLNGKQIIQGVDTATTCTSLTDYSSCAITSGGAPGFGFWHQNTYGQNTDFGISKFVASDLSPPSGLSAVVH